MTPKEKAKVLFDKIMVIQLVSNKLDCPNMTQEIVKQCALIAINEMIEHSRNISMIYDLSFDDSKSFFSKVKQEIEKL